MSQPLQAPTHNRAETADPGSAVAEIMSKNDNRTFWQRHRMPLILGIIAACLYLGSIVWMAYARGFIG